MSYTVRTPSESRNLAALLVEEFPPFPAVAWKILEMTTDMYSGTTELTEVLSKDQALAGRVLRLANSAFFGYPAQVSSIRRALVVAGNRRVRALVVAASLEAIFKRTTFGASLWAHSLAVSWTVAELAHALKYPEPQEAYLAGLLHDIGKSVLDTHYRDSYCEVMALAQVEGKPAMLAEREVLGFDHTEIGSELAREWNLPPQLTDVVRFHHSPRLAPEFPFLCALVNFADGICVKRGIGPKSEPDLDYEELEAHSILQIDFDLANRKPPIRPERISDA